MLDLDLAPLIDQASVVRVRNKALSPSSVLLPVLPMRTTAISMSPLEHNNQVPSDQPTPRGNFGAGLPYGCNISHVHNTMGSVWPKTVRHIDISQ